MDSPWEYLATQNLGMRYLGMSAVSSYNQSNIMGCDVFSILVDDSTVLKPSVYNACSKGCGK